MEVHNKATGVVFILKLNNECYNFPLFFIRKNVFFAPDINIAA